MIPLKYGYLSRFSKLTKVDSALEVICGFNTDKFGDTALIIYFPYPLSLKTPSPFMITCVPKCLPRKKKYNPFLLFVSGAFKRRFIVSDGRLPSLMRKIFYKIPERSLKIFQQPASETEIIIKIKKEKLI